MKKKELILEYREREVIGGIFQIKNIKRNKIFIDYAVDIQGVKNRFNFSKTTNSSPNLILMSDWEQDKQESFEFEILEQKKKKADQTEKEFREKLEELKELWKEKNKEQDMY